MDAATLKEILDLPPELRGAAFEEAVKGRRKSKIRNLSKLARHVMNRDNRPTAYISLDEERDEDDGYSLHERLAATDPQDLVDFLRARTRTAMFDEQTEAVLDIARQGAAALGRSLNLTGRRGQQIMKKQIGRVDEARKFKEGGRGQGTLFGFDGEVA